MPWPGVSRGREEARYTDLAANAVTRRPPSSGGIYGLVAVGIDPADAGNPLWLCPSDLAAVVASIEVSGGSGIIDLESYLACGALEDRSRTVAPPRGGPWAVPFEGLANAAYALVTFYYDDF